MAKVQANWIHVEWVSTVIVCLLDIKWAPSLPTLNYLLIDGK